jgi:broad specificity phosphatase PhoE
VAAAEPERTAEWLKAGAHWRFPGGESLQDQLDRVSECVEEIRHGADEPALAVCHGGSIRVMLCRSDPRGLDAFHDFQVPNIAVVSV